MKKYLFLAALMLIGAVNMNAASPKKKAKVTPEAKGVASINRATAEAHVEFLACDELEGREAGWKGGRIAGNYIISCLKQMGTDTLLSGAEQLADGVSKFNTEGIDKLYDAIFDKLLARIDVFDALKEIARSHVNYSGIKDGMQGSVMYIYRTEGIG